MCVCAKAKRGVVFVGQAKCQTVMLINKMQETDLYSRVSIVLRAVIGVSNWQMRFNRSNILIIFNESGL